MPLFSVVFAPMYWGFVVSTALLGTTLIQGYIYYTHSRDSLSIQLVIALMLILDMSSTVAIAVTVSHYFLVNYGNCSILRTVPAEWVVENTLTAIVTCISQLFFATRIQIIMKEYPVFGRLERMIPGIIACTAFLALVAGIGKTVLVGTVSLEELSGTHMIIVLSLEDTLALISDLFTTGTLCRILSPSQGGLHRTTSQMRRLFFFILNRGVLVTVLQIGTLVTFVSRPTTLYWAPFHLAKSKLYANTLLAMLNSRTQAEHTTTPQTSRFSRSVPLQDVSNEDTSNQVRSEMRDRIQASEDARVNWDALPIPGASEKRY